MKNHSIKNLHKNVPPVVDYESIQCRRHPAAMAALILGIVAIATSWIGVGILPGIVAIGLGIWMTAAVDRKSHVYSGKEYANVAVALGCLACVVPMVLLVLLGSVDREPRPAYRAYCAANLRGIAQSIVVYATDNSDVFPVLPYAPYGLMNSGVSTATFSGTSDDAAKSLDAGGGAQDGSPLAGVWLLMLKNYTSPKQYVCKADPFVSDVASLEKSPGIHYLNFQSSHQLSYSFAYPYAPDGTVGAWWKNTTDASVPIASDMAPLNGTGKPPRNLAPGIAPKKPQMWNSANHHGDGENVAFADGHAEFVRHPDVGQDNDNIFTLSGVKGVSEFGGAQPGKAPIEIKTDAAPFDVVMLPARNLNTGGF